MELFSEGLFIILFYNESTFDIPLLKESIRVSLRVVENTNNWVLVLLGNKNWGSKKRRTGTCAYVLMQNAQQTYHVTFCWKERVYKEFEMSLRCGSMHFEFNIDVRDFVEENHDENQARNLN
ncbi:hypothetical protein RhiirA5_496006 [Rhizophagus irregularis]|uniref:Uncharacterized protein n=1 Tax=Rhizophagus irregularis TaxID=588596 RepID=A0A2I1DTP1_9GLOM|nr:hypothetical protein RhiirA5_496006 [Rhizophagus irregularis]PKY13241.1 hypothetical protein RhiirB3_518643 [Rhizophagus irregularis]GBC43294.1 hypothetical protein GLOIN_2v848380 [Rhizophagus irregularis DAOM 181602=DAOM 197198]CAB5339130.1 unnamed protein product [Rhizophagus irregularis]